MVNVPTSLNKFKNKSWWVDDVGNLKTVPIYLKSRLVDKSCKQKQCLRNYKLQKLLN